MLGAGQVVEVFEGAQSLIGKAGNQSEVPYPLGRRRPGMMWALTGNTCGWLQRRSRGTLKQE